MNYAIPRSLWLLVFTILVLILGPTEAFGAEVTPGVPGPGDSTPVSDGPAATAVNLYLIALGAVTPLVGYVLNHYAPWATEQIKGIVQGMLAAGVAVLYQAVTGSDLGLNAETLLAVMTAMGAALLGHLGWKSASINTSLGAGTNAPRRVVHSDPN